jgi:DNA-binding transcriptional LysR family regulator
MQRSIGAEATGVNLHDVDPAFGNPERNRRSCAMRFDLTDLRLFLEVADAGNLTHGAERAHLSVASASARVRGMEQMLGVKLLERLPRGVQLTPAGLALTEHARALLQRAQQMRGDLAQFARGIKAQVRLLANTSALAEHVPKPLGAFLLAHPQVDVYVEERTSAEIALGLLRQQADVGICSASVELAGLATRPFVQDRLVAVAAPTHALARKASCSFAQVLDHELVGLTAGSALHDHLVWQAERTGRTMRLRARLRGFDGVCALAAQSVGVAVVPESAARRARRSMKLAMVWLTDTWASRDMLLALRSWEEATPAVRAFIDALSPR